MSIRQFNAGYAPVEDRVLFRVAMANNDEYRFWLTRNVLRGFFAQVEQWLAPRDASTQAAVESFRREAAVAGADFDTPLTPGDHLPLGEVPLLVSTMRLTVDHGVHVVLTLADGREADFGLSTEVLVGIRHMLKQAVTAADWGLLPVAADLSAATTGMRMH